MCVRLYVSHFIFMLFGYLLSLFLLCCTSPPTELDLLPFTVTFLMSFWQIQYGIIGGVVVSGVLLLYNTARPQIKVAEWAVRRTESGN